MAKSTNENNTVALGKRPRTRGRLVDVGKHQYLCTWRLEFQQALFMRAHHQRYIRFGNDLQLDSFHLSGRANQFCILRDVRFALLPQEV